MPTPLHIHRLILQLPLLCMFMSFSGRCAAAVHCVILFFFSLIAHPAECGYLHIYTQNNQWRVWRKGPEHQESFVDIIVLSMQSMKTDGEFYGMTLCICVFVCVQGQARETADLAEILKDRKQKAQKMTLFLSCPPFLTPSITFFFYFSSLFNSRKRDHLWFKKRSKRKQHTPCKTVCVCDH